MKLSHTLSILFILAIVFFARPYAAYAGYCGDFMCTTSEGENLANCANDCGYCGDGICVPGAGENVITCPSECGTGPGSGYQWCGDAICNNGETTTSCVQDCSVGGTALCGDGTCNGVENGLYCPEDCGSTGGGGGGSGGGGSGGGGSCSSGAGGDCFGAPSSCGSGFYCDPVAGYTCQYGGQPGQCGVNAENSWAGTVFAYNVNSYPSYYGGATDFCQYGTPNQAYSSIPFPAQGSTATWSCLPADDILACMSPVTCTSRRASAPPADLTASSVTPSTVTVGSSISFSATISNTGGLSTGSSFSNFFQAASSVNGGGTITDIGAVSMSALGAGANAVATSPVYTFSSAGMRSVRVCADRTTSSPSSGSISESDENNNCSAWQTVTVSSSPIIGSCGTADKTYAYNISGYGTDVFCNNGTLNWIGPGVSGSFPAQGTSKTWTCIGQNGGSNSPTCTASRNNPPATLSVNVVTSGQGIVTSTSNPSQTNINCGALCAATYDAGTVVTLTAQPSSPSRIFIGWSGDCSGTNPTCTLTVNSAKSVTAKFGINPNFKEF